MTNKFIKLALLAAERGQFKKLVFSRPSSADAARVTARLCKNGEKELLSFEYAIADTVRQVNKALGDAKELLQELSAEYRQANLITSLGDAELKTSKKGATVLLGGDALLRKLSEERPRFEAAIEALDKEKSRLLSGSEPFLTALGISDKSGRVHDKRQGKFRQINRFLEHVEDIYSRLPAEGTLNVYDLCCGKSYLSFAVYHYLTSVKGRRVSMLGIDLKRDVISHCAALAGELGFSGMRFVCGDIRETPRDVRPDLVISLHACDVATDVVLEAAIDSRAEVILSTPCCHRHLKAHLDCAPLDFIARYGHLKNKLCEVITDGLRAARLRAAGYHVAVLEMTDPDDTPKNTLIRALRADGLGQGEIDRRRAEYEAAKRFALGEHADEYLTEIIKHR